MEAFFTRERIETHIVMETENVEIIKAMVRNGLGISVIPWQAAAEDVRQKQLFCSRISGHTLTRQTGWIYPKMSRLPRMVAGDESGRSGQAPPQKRRCEPDLRSSPDGPEQVRRRRAEALPRGCSIFRE